MGTSREQRFRISSPNKNPKKNTRRKRRPSPSDSDYCSDERRRHTHKRRHITEEEITGYVAKKAQKKAAKAAEKLETRNVSGYSNESNPFNDSNLNKKFIWRKKIERDVEQGAPLDIFSKKRQREREAEIERVKKRREEWAIQKAQREEEREMIERERQRAEFQDWKKKEDEFYFNQIKLRSDIRLREGRAKPIDVFSKFLDGLDANFDFDVDPCTLIKGLTIQEIEELHDEVQVNLDLDNATPVHTEFWQALMVVCDSHLAEARKEESHRELHSSIEADVRDFLQGKSFKELERLSIQIESELLLGTAKVVEFWEALVRHLHIYKAKAWLKEFHMKQLCDGHRQRPVSKEKHSDMGQVIDCRQYSPQPVTNEDMEQEVGSYSPQLTYVKESENVIDPQEDQDELERKRASVLQQQSRLRQAMALNQTRSEDDNMELKAMKSMGEMGEGDAVLGSAAEINLEHSHAYWHKKYRPHKPKYFNRVHSGYEWNKYNRVHYDHDNPPPKMVQGYKFNIFYPDLVDKSKAPTFVIEDDGSNGETCIIRFHAGPPYEDIAFRIVNKEWEKSQKKGFKCTFDRGVLHLYVNFKRYSYRR